MCDQDQIPRRAFLAQAGGLGKLGALGLLAASMTDVGTAPASDAAAKVDLANAGVEDFGRLVGETFAVGPGESHGRSIRLVEARPYRTPSGRPAGGAPGRPFSLFFRDGGPGVALESSTYRVRHPAHGSFDLFLVPVGPPTGAGFYEAVFG